MELFGTIPWFGHKCRGEAWSDDRCWILRMLLSVPESEQFWNILKTLENTSDCQSSIIRLPNHVSENGIYDCHVAVD